MLPPVMDRTCPIEKQPEHRPPHSQSDSSEPHGAILDQYPTEVLEAVLRILKSQRPKRSTSGTRNRFRPIPQ
jgi:hypothetical protein